MRGLVILFIKVVIIIFSQGYLYSQFQCPPDSGINCSPWELGIYTTTTETPSCSLIVHYRWRNCNGSYQIYIDNVQKTGNCEYLEEGSNMSNFQEWLDLVLIEEIVDLSLQYPPPDCPNSSQKVIFYTATCGLWVKCEYTIDETTRDCQVDWRGEYPDYAVDGARKINIWKWQSCGVTCCRKEYSICKEQDTSNGSYTIQIKSLIKTQIGECTNPEGFVAPCQHGC